MTHDILKEAISKRAKCFANFGHLYHIDYSLNQLSGLNEMEQLTVQNIRKELEKLIEGQRRLMTDSNGLIVDLLAEMPEIKGGKE